MQLLKDANALGVSINTKRRNSSFVFSCFKEESFGISSAFGTPFTVQRDQRLLPFSLLQDSYFLVGRTVLSDPIYGGGLLKDPWVIISSPTPPGPCRPDCRSDARGIARPWRKHWRIQKQNLISNHFSNFDQSTFKPQSGTYGGMLNHVKKDWCNK